MARQVATDYHNELLTRLRSIEAGLLAQTSCTTRSYVDTGPLVERVFAEQAGVGWIGKNTCVIEPEARLVAPAGRHRDVAAG